MSGPNLPNRFVSGQALRAEALNLVRDALPRVLVGGPDILVKRSGSNVAIENTTRVTRPNPLLAKVTGEGTVGDGAGNTDGYYKATEQIWDDSTNAWIDRTNARVWDGDTENGNLPELYELNGSTDVSTGSIVIIQQSTGDEGSTLWWFNSRESLTMIRSFTWLGDGTYTWTPTADQLRGGLFLEAWIIGAGGGGGGGQGGGIKQFNVEVGASSGSTANAGGGGGGGGGGGMTIVRYPIFKDEDGASLYEYTIIVGAGGAKGTGGAGGSSAANGNDGSDGGDSSVQGARDSEGSLITYTGFGGDGGEGGNSGGADGGQGGNSQRPGLSGFPGELTVQELQMPYLVGFNGADGGEGGVGNNRPGHQGRGGAPIIYGALLGSTVQSIGGGGLGGAGGAWNNDAGSDGFDGADGGVMIILLG